MLEPRHKDVTVNCSFTELEADGVRARRGASGCAPGFWAPCQKRVDGARAWVLVMEVCVPASSTNTSVFGPTTSTSCRHAALASGFCSLAARVFFPCHLCPLQGPAHGLDERLGPLLFVPKVAGVTRKVFVASRAALGARLYGAPYFVPTTSRLQDLPV